MRPNPSHHHHPSGRHLLSQGRYQLVAGSRSEYLQLIGSGPRVHPSRGAGGWGQQLSPPNYPVPGGGSRLAPSAARCLAGGAARACGNPCLPNTTPAQAVIGSHMRSHPSPPCTRREGFRQAITTRLPLDYFYSITSCPPPSPPVRLAELVRWRLRPGPPWDDCEGGEHKAFRSRRSTQCAGPCKDLRL